MWRIMKAYPRLFLRKLFPNKSISLLFVITFIFLPWYFILRETPPSQSHNPGQVIEQNMAALNNIIDQKNAAVVVPRETFLNQVEEISSSSLLSSELTTEKTILEEREVERKETEKNLDRTKEISSIVIENKIPVTVDPNAPGELGEPFNIEKDKLSPEDRKLYDEGWRRHQFNQYASDKISLHRSLKDFRNKLCKQETFPSDLPDTSVIVIFHNEAWSTLLRTVHSVLDKSPEHLLKEIILVDDASTFDHLKTPLEDYINALNKVKIIRSQSREGLIRARLLGAEHAQGKVLTFLDSHCECLNGWLEPLLFEIAKNESTVVCPVIDVINDETFQYHGSNSMVFTGGFQWALSFTWHAATPHEKRARSSIIGPLLSPTMAGGLFSISKSYFEYLGKYDEGMEIWGAENLEISFRIWMCGGQLEILPCSRVGHVFRKTSPYSWGQRGTSVLLTNTYRLIEVWLDEYKYYYEIMSGRKVGKKMGTNIESRKELRRKLECKSFKWYLENVYPSIFDPGRMKMIGEVRSHAGSQNHCLDGGTKQGERINIYECHGNGGHQVWFYSPSGEIRKSEICLDYSPQSTSITLNSCHGREGNQAWDLKEGQIVHRESQLCLTADMNTKRLHMSNCDSNDPASIWTFSNLKEKIESYKMQ